MILLCGDLTKTMMSRSKTAKNKKRFRLRWIERALLLVAVLCLGYWGYAWLDSAYVQYRDNQILDAASERRSGGGLTRPGRRHGRGRHRLPGGFQDPPPAGDQAAQPAADEGSLVGRIEIPRLGVSAIVLEGVDAQTLRRGVGHIPETSLPGGPGNVGARRSPGQFFPCPERHS